MDITKEEEKCIIDDFEEAFAITFLSKKYNRDHTLITKILVRRYGLDEYKRLVAEHFKIRNPHPKEVKFSEKEKNEIVDDFANHDFSVKKLGIKYKHGCGIMVRFLTEKMGEDEYKKCVKKHRGSTFLKLNIYKRVEISKEEGGNIIQEFLKPNANIQVIVTKYHHSYAKIKNFLIDALGEMKYNELLSLHRRCGKPCIKNEANPNWRGGSSFEPYCIKFNDDFKEKVREYWNRKCVLCNKSETENDEKLHVHHVNYNKDTCCDDSKPSFVVLCRSCHTKTNFKREFWEQKLKDFIYSNNANGKCFYTKEEMKNKKKENEK